MSKILFTLSTNALTAFVDGVPYTVLRSDPRFTPLYEAMKNKDYSAVPDIVIESPVLAMFNDVLYDQGDYRVDKGKVFYKDREVEGFLINKLFEFLEEGLDTMPMILHIGKVLSNPSFNSVRELIDGFLFHRNLPVDEDGDVIGWKGLRDDEYSCHGNKRTIVLTGKVDASGRIYNGDGETIRVDRSQVDDNPNHYCSYGLHVGTWDYASSFGDITKSVKFNPADAVSVPHDGHKLRLCGYKVIERVTIPDSGLVYGTSVDSSYQEELMDEIVFDLLEDNPLNVSSAVALVDVVEEFNKEVGDVDDKVDSEEAAKLIRGLGYRVIGEVVTHG